MAVVGEPAASGAPAETTNGVRVWPSVRVVRTPNQGLIRRFRWAFDTRYMNLHGCVASVDDQKRLMAEYDGFDLVWVLNTRTPNILNRWRWPRSVLDTDDLPSTFERTVLHNGESISTRLKSAIRSPLLRRRENRFLERFTILSVCSETDRQYLGGTDRIHVIPNGFPRPLAEPERRPTSPPRLGFIGLYSYYPNLDGMRWFIRRCWPHIKKAIPNVRLRLVGRDSETESGPGEQGIDRLGWLPDPSAEIASWSAMIVPIRCGAGTRVKIADAFSRKCPVVSTSVGAFGYEVRDGVQLRLADSAEDFAAACVRAALDHADAAAMAERAWRDFINKWTWEAISPRVWETAEHCLRRSLSEGFS